RRRHTRFSRDWSSDVCSSDLYGSVDILHDVKFSIGAAEIVVVLGRNGVGKTTLMKALIGLLPPRSGHIQFNGKEIRGLPPHLIRSEERRVGKGCRNL